MNIIKLPPTKQYERPIQNLRLQDGQIGRVAQTDVGDPEQRLYSLAAWRECPYYSDKERAALAYAEAVTANHVDDFVFEELKPFFSKQEIADLTLAIATINTWNRLNRAFRTVPGGYRVGQHA